MQSFNGKGEHFVDSKRSAPKYGRNEFNTESFVLRNPAMNAEQDAKVLLTPSEAPTYEETILSIPDL